ncbi:MAG TPA: nitroreductase family protein [Ilumatobacter sp.]|nr:nitroreductase family protein [Ilumatobacter sp.]
MDLREALRTTGAVRSFTDRPVANEVLVDVLDTARFAPSGGNRQPWKVTVVNDRELRRQLGTLMQPTWNEYRTASAEGQTPFNAVDYVTPADIAAHPNPLLDALDTIPVVLVVAADLRLIVAADGNLDRVAVVPGASIYPFCWNLLLAARSHGLGGVLTTFLSRSEPEAGVLLDLPEHHAIVAMLCLGYPVHQPTKLSRDPVVKFASIDGFGGDQFG